MRFLVLILCLSAIWIAGCTTASLKDGHLVALSYAAVNTSQAPSKISASMASLASNSSTLEVHVGFIGMCASWIPGDWRCSSDAQALQPIIQTVSTPPGQPLDPLNIIHVARTFRDNIVFDGCLWVQLF